MFDIPYLSLGYECKLRTVSIDSIERLVRHFASWRPPYK